MSEAKVSENVGFGGGQHIYIYKYRYRYRDRHIHMAMENQSNHPRPFGDDTHSHHGPMVFDGIFLVFGSQIPRSNHQIFHSEITRSPGRQLTQLIIAGKCHQVERPFVSWEKCTHGFQSRFSQQNQSIEKMDKNVHVCVLISIWLYKFDTY